MPSWNGLLQVTAVTRESTYVLHEQVHFLNPARVRIVRSWRIYLSPSFRVPFVWSLEAEEDAKGRERPKQSSRKSPKSRG